MLRGTAKAQSVRRLRQTAMSLSGATAALAAAQPCTEGCLEHPRTSCGAAAGVPPSPQHLQTMYFMDSGVCW